jgi:AraC-like DNA-binding protein
MSDLGVWTPQEIADEIDVSRQFVIDVITGKTKRYTLPASKKGRNWLISESDAKQFIREYRTLESEFYTPLQIAQAVGMTRKYVLDQLTGYGGRKKPRLAGEKRGDRWVVTKEEAERFIDLHRKRED